MRLTNIAKTFYCVTFFNLFRLLPLKKKQAIFISFSGRQYSDNPKVIYLHMLRSRSMDKLVWVLDDESKIPKHQKLVIVKLYSFKYLYYLATSKYRIDNDLTNSALLKPKKNTIYLATWHGTPIKRIGLDVAHSNSLLGKWFLKTAARHITYFLSPCNEEITELLANAFGIAKNKIISLGSPRNDIFVEKKANSDEIKERIKPNLSKTNKKIILYAPTFRDKGINDNSNINFDALKKQLGDEIVFLVRGHHYAKIKYGLSDQEFVFDVTNYPDMQELLYIADVLITDYSSSFFDYALLARPIIFYPYDLEKYTNEIRGLYYNYIDFVPGPIAYSFEDLIIEIRSCIYDPEAYVSKIKNFSARYSNQKICTSAILREIGFFDN